MKGKDREGEKGKREKGKGRSKEREKGMGRKWVSKCQESSESQEK